MKDMSGILAKYLRLGVVECEVANQLLEKDSCLPYLKYYALGDAARLNPSQWSRLADLKQSLEKFSEQLALSQFEVQDFFYLQDLKKPEQIDCPLSLKESDISLEVNLENIENEDLLNYKATNELLKKADILHLMRMKLFSEATLTVKEKTTPSEYVKTILAEFRAENTPLIKKLNPFLFLKLWHLYKQGQISFEISLIESLAWQGEGLPFKTPKIEKSMAYALTTYIQPKLFREVIALAYDRAVEAIMPVLEVQFRHIFRQAPKATKTMLMIYPHGKSGIMLVCVNEKGELLDESMLYPFAPDYNQEDGVVHLSKLLTRYPIEDIAWLVQPETKRLVQKLLGKVKERYAFLNWHIHPISNRYQHWFVPKGQKHPTIDNVLAACHFAQNPWLFWASISPELILNPVFVNLPKNKVKNLWRNVLQEFLMLNGLNVQTAEKELLALVDGLSVEDILKAREQNNFNSTEDLKQILGLNDKSFEWMQLFLRISDDEIKKGPLLLDFDNENDLSMDKDLRVKKLKAIQQSMTNEPKFYEESLKTELKPGQTFYGLVTRVMSYGVFVDLGDKMEGLLHVSAIGDCFVNDLNLIFNPGDFVSVECISFDEQKKRLSLKLCSTWDLPNLIVKSEPAKKPLIKKTHQKVKKQEEPKLNKAPQAPTAMELAFAKLKQQS